MSRAVFEWEGKPGVKGWDLECKRRAADYGLTVTAEMPAKKTRMEARTFLMPGLWECALITYPGGVKSKVVTIGSK